MWGSAPYEKYVFLNLLTEAGGGLEHKNSTVLMASRWATSTPQRYQNWLGLVSHEFFHAWNVKRLRPVELGPFDYDREVYTPSLWIAEGVTDYYGDVMLRRAGSDRRWRAGRGRGTVDPHAADHAGTARAAGRGCLVRRVDPPLPAGRELAERGDQLLHEGRGARLPARREDPQGDRRREEPRRCDAARDAALRRREGLHAAGIPADGPRGRGRGLRRVVARRARHDRRSSIIRRRSTGTACASVRPTSVSARATLGLDDEGRRRPPARLAGAARHARLRRGHQCGRRDRGAGGFQGESRTRGRRRWSATRRDSASRCSWPGAIS